VRKHESLNKVTKEVKDMVIQDLTRLHYCLEYEYEPYKEIVIKKWKSMPELADFVVYCWNQWFVGTFANWHIFKTPPGFANTNNPLESFNKIIKAIFTHFLEHRLFNFIMLIIEHILPYYCSIDKAFKLYRVPHKKTIQASHNLKLEKFEMEGSTKCKYYGAAHVHTIDFVLKSCTCRWFLAFCVCAHLVAACDKFNQPLEGYTKTKVFVYRARRGRKRKEIEMSVAACSAMPVIPIPAANHIIIESRRDELFQLDATSLQLPGLNPDFVPECAPGSVPDSAPDGPVLRITRAYTKKVVQPVVVKVPKTARTKRLVKPSVPVPVVINNSPRKRGRPRKNPPALMC